MRARPADGPELDLSRPHACGGNGDRVAHRVTSATRRLYQFMNADVARLIVR